MRCIYRESKIVDKQQSIKIMVYVPETDKEVEDLAPMIVLDNEFTNRRATEVFPQRTSEARVIREAIKMIDKAEVEAVHIK